MMDATDLDLVRRGAELVIDGQLASVNRMQRRLEVDYFTATGIMDILEEHGVVGPDRVGPSRAVLRRPDELPTVLEQLKRSLTDAEPTS